MIENEPKLSKELPVGTGRESEPKEILPAVEVDNEVVWVNPDFEEMPFDFREGEPTKLGVFLTPKPKEGDKAFKLKVTESHNRSGFLGRAIFKDRDGQLYRDIDMKGTGHLEFRKDEPKIQSVYIKAPRESSYGILDMKHAETVKYMAEKFNTLGIRTERYLALIKLKEIVDKFGKKVSIEQAIQKNMINDDEEPVIAIRGLGTKFRIHDVSDGNKDINTERLEDAKKLVVQELGIKDEDFTWDDYLKWFAETAGKNLGLMHKNNLHHGYLTGHNITLDCRIIDLDSVEELGPLKNCKEEEQADILWRYDADYRSLKAAITDRIYSLFDGISHSIGIKISNAQLNELEDIFDRSYKKNLSYTPEFLKEKEEL